MDIKREKPQRRRLSRKQARESAIELMDRVGIPDSRRRADDHPHQFSGGLRQRLMIAAAVALRPRVLIADEPTTALDVTIQAQIMRLLHDLQSEFGIAIVLMTHDLAVVAEHAKCVSVMYAGTVVEEGSVQQIFQQSAHPYTQALLRSMLDAIPVGCVFHQRCPMAQQICREVRPAPRPSSTGHLTSCHFWELVS